MIKEQKKYDKVKQEIYKMIKKYGDDNVFPAFATILIESMGGDTAVNFMQMQHEFLDRVGFKP